MKRLTHKTSNSKCPTRRPIGFGSAVLCACLSTACSEYKPGTDTLLGSAGALTERPAPVGNGDWSCLGEQSPNARPLPDEPGAEAVYGLRLVDLATLQPFPDVTVTPCALPDVPCDRPVRDPVQPTAQGFVDIPLYENFLGYLEIESPSAVPYIFHLPDEGLTTARDFPLAMISKANFVGISTILGVPIDQTLGAIAVRAFDCAGEPAEGVKFQIDEGIGWYFERDLPTLEREYTDIGGLGGFVNARPGLTNFTATLSNGQPLTNKRVIVRAGWMTAGYMRPRVAD